jgi:hypothetical protein
MVRTINHNPLRIVTTVTSDHCYSNDLDVTVTFLIIVGFVILLVALMTLLPLTSSTLMSVSTYAISPE